MKELADEADPETPTGAPIDLEAVPDESVVPESIPAATPPGKTQTLNPRAVNAFDEAPEIEDVPMEDNEPLVSPELQDPSEPVLVPPPIEPPAKARQVKPTWQNDARYCEILNRIFVLEGKYADLMGDSGGETMYGISKQSYPDLDIKRLTQVMAGTIYWNDFYNELHLHQIKNQEVAFTIMHLAVISGQKTATRMVQDFIVRAYKATLSSSPSSPDRGVDGNLGSRTVNAINQIAKREPEILVHGIELWFGAHCKELCVKNQEKEQFIRSWVRRTLL